MNDFIREKNKRIFKSNEKHTDDFICDKNWWKKCANFLFLFFAHQDEWKWIEIAVIDERKTRLHFNCHQSKSIELINWTKKNKELNINRFSVLFVGG